MLLTFDIGNSAVKGALYQGDECVQRMHFSTDEIYSPTGIVDGLHLALDERTVSAVGYVSVVPVVADRVQVAVQILLGMRMKKIDAASDNPLVLDYETPETLGSDRVAAVTAAHLLYGKSANGEPRSVIVIDAGTAVTCDFVSHDGIYSGGSIGAGPRLIHDALHKSTAQLPEVELKLPDELPARGTQESLQAGIMYGFMDSVSGIVRRIADKASDKPYVLATGGWAKWLNEHCEEVDEEDQDLVLHGVRLLMQYEQRAEEADPKP